MPASKNQGKNYTSNSIILKNYQVFVHILVINNKQAQYCIDLREAITGIFAFKWVTLINMVPN